MAAQRLIVAIGRIERSLSRIEQLPVPALPGGHAELAVAHEKLKMETKAAIADIDRILAGAG
jgi:hypothetical protein